MILCEHGPGAEAALFDGAERLILAWQAVEVGPALVAADAALAAGKWVAGYLAYEAGLALEPRLCGLMPDGCRGPLLALGVYSGPVAADGLLARAAAEADRVRLPAFHGLTARADYDRAMQRIAEYLAAGDTYQINLTFAAESRLEAGSALGLYGKLRALQPVGFGAYCDLGVGPVVVSRSPELFFSVDSGGMISARPMKGTAPRGSDPSEDAEFAEVLFRSEKARAENLMIVDLLRNDMSRLCEVGSVKVPELFAVEAFATVHQMSSRVVGKLAGQPGLAGLMRALFPCGSVTGAPKIRAMEIIAELEARARGVYCGAVGWMAPDGQATFSVAIRTLEVAGDRVLLNVGGGVVADSTAQGEWEEAWWKARFVTGLAGRA